MKTSAVAAVVVVLAGGPYLGATAYTGHRVAAAYEARLARLEQQFPFLHVVDRHTERGLFSSTYSGQVRVGCLPDLKDGSQPGKPLVIGFRDQVRHGPLPEFSSIGAAVIESQIVLPEEAPAPLRQYLAGMKPQDIRTVVGFGGDYQTAVRLPAGDYALPAGQLSWPDAHFTGSGQVDGSASAFDGHLPEIAFRGADQGGTRGVSFKLVNLRWQGANRGEGNIWMRPGSSSMEIERIELLGDAGGKTFSAQVGKLKYLAEVGVDKDLLGVKATVTADATVQLGSEAKPIQLDNIEFQESIRRLHVPTLQKVVEASMADLATCGAADVPAVDPVLRSQALLRTMAGLLPHAPEISVDKLAVSYDGQRGELSYAVSAPGLTARDIEATGAALQAQLQRKLMLRADAKLPVAWIEQIGARSGDEAGAAQRVAQANTMLDLALGKGFVVREGDHVTSSLVVEGGAVILNGKPFGGDR